MRWGDPPPSTPIPLPRLSRCVPTVRRTRPPLLPGHVVRAAMVAAVLAVLAVGQVHLRVIAADLRRDCFRLQAVRRELTERAQYLERDTAVLSSLPRIEWMARGEMGLEDVEPTNSLTAVLPREIARRYELATPGTLAPVDTIESAVASVQSSTARGFLLAFLDFNKAFAAAAELQSEAHHAPPTKADTKR